MDSQHPPATALLLGKNHTDLGSIAVETLGPNTAIALSRGQFAKGYPSTEPNEDAVFAATDGVTTLLAVADGHGGFDAANAAIAAVAGAALDALASADPAAAAVALLAAAHARIANQRSSARFPDAGTTLTVALIRGSTASIARVGDTPALLVRRSRVRRLSTTSDFLGQEKMPRPRSSRARLRPGDWLLVASDGLTDFLGVSWKNAVLQVATREPAAFASALIATAHRGGAGDNVAVGLHRVPTTD